MKTGIYIGITTFDNQEKALEIAEFLINSKLCACAQLEAPMISIYQWENKTEKTQEFRLLLKFCEAQKKKLQEKLFELHPYETPQWIIIEANDVGDGYSDWVKNSAK